MKQRVGQGMLVIFLLKAGCMSGMESCKKLLPDGKQSIADELIIKLYWTIEKIRSSRDVVLESFEQSCHAILSNCMNRRIERLERILTLLVGYHDNLPQTSIELWENARSCLQKVLNAEPKIMMGQLRWVCLQLPIHYDENNGT